MKTRSRSSAQKQQDTLNRSEPKKEPKKRPRTQSKTHSKKKEQPQSKKLETKQVGSYGLRRSRKKVNYKEDTKKYSSSEEPDQVPEDTNQHKAQPA